MKASRRLADRIAELDGSGVRFEPAEVTAYTAPTVSVRWRGAVVTAKHLGSYAPVVGDVVLVAVNPPQIVVLGAIGAFEPVPLTITQQAANYTLVLADAGTEVEGTKATAQTVTVPPNSSVAFPVGTVINVRQYGAGQITITPGSGVTLRAPNGAKTAVQYSTVTLIKRATNEWVLGGDTTT